MTIQQALGRNWQLTYIRSCLLGAIRPTTPRAKKPLHVFAVGFHNALLATALATQTAARGFLEESFRSSPVTGSGSWRKRYKREDTHASAIVGATPLQRSLLRVSG